VLDRVAGDHVVELSLFICFGKADLRKIKVNRAYVLGCHAILGAVVYLTVRSQGTDRLMYLAERACDRRSVIFRTFEFPVCSLATMASGDEVEMRAGSDFRSQLKN
jgi:hypothetical protein